MIQGSDVAPAYPKTPWPVSRDVDMRLGRLRLCREIQARP